MSEIRVPVSVGELLDKLSILSIKAERIQNAQQVANVERELQALIAEWRASGLDRAEVAPLQEELKAVNQRLWDIEDALRQKEARQNFDAEFVALARRVYIENDRRAAIKRAINQLTGSLYIEEKSYQSYQQGTSS